MGPSQLTSASGVQARYDGAGNLVELKIERAGVCPTGAAGSKCAQWFAYDWDEVGQLARARRWDFASTVPVLGAGALPAETPEWSLTYAYSGGSRVVKSAMDSGGVERHTLEVFDTLRFDHDEFIVADGDYERSSSATHVYLAGGIAHVFDDGGTLPRPASAPATRLFLNIGDHLGSASVTIDHATSEVVERATFASHGAIESDYRPDRWGQNRERYKFTGKEEDIEVGATYFGARYYNAHLGRFISPDPLTIHGLGADLNPYAYVGGHVMSHVDPLGLDETPLPNDVEAWGTGASGQYVDPQNGTVVNWTYSGVGASVGGPSAFGRLGPTVAVGQLIGSLHIPLWGDNYFTLAGLATVGGNAIKGTAIAALDPIGYRHLAKATGADVEGAAMSAVGDGPKDRSQIVGSVVLVAGSLLAGKIAAPSAGAAAAEAGAAEAGGGLADSALVCRGGTCTAERFASGSGVTVDSAGKLQEVSVNSGPGTSLEQLTSSIPNKQVGVTTVGQVRAAGGNVIPSPRPNNPFHCTLCGITPNQAETLFTPTIQNPTLFRF